MNPHTKPNHLRRASLLLLAGSLSAVPPLLGQLKPETETTAAPQTASPTPAPVRRPTPVPVETVESSSGSSEILELSPFEITTANDKGYLAASALSGSRLNTKLEDIAASLSVVTKQQLEDTGAVDINDVFKYEVNTEGTSQWTSFTNDRGNISDDIQSNPHGATRMRGLTAANVAVGSFTTTLPIDTYNVESIEVSRGPNSTIFGPGATGGGINLNVARAKVSGSVTRFQTKIDNNDGYRASFDINRAIINGKLGLRALAVYDDKGFVRQPASDLTRRLMLAATFKPYRNTTIRGSFESYRNFNNRANSTTPRDLVSDWIASGKPTWDPIANTVHFLDGRAPITGITTSNEATLLPYGIATTNSALTTFPSWYIDNGQVGLYTINRMPAATGTGPNNTSGTNRLLESGTFLGRTANANLYPLYVTPGVTNKDYYDWTSINLASPNYGRIKGETSMLELEQIILNTPRHTLALQAGWFNERTSTNSRSFLGSTDGGKLQVYIDINEKLLDGSANPYFLRPYVGGSQPAFKKARNNSETIRSNLAYGLNFTQESNWLRFLGKHSFSAYNEYREIFAGSLGYKDTMTSTEAWMTTPVASRNTSSFRTSPRYYLGDNQGYNVDYAPVGLAAPTGQATYNLRYYNGVSGQWINESVDFGEYYYANRLNRRLLTTYGAVWQGSFWNDRIVPIYGARRDYNRTRDGNSAIAPTAATDGYYDTSTMDQFGQYDWVRQMGNTTQAGIVAKVLPWLHLSYNQSNSFQPGSLAYNVYGAALPDPRGETKDYGFALSLFQDRLYIRAKQYETVDRGRGTSEINTYVQRAVRLDADGNTTAGDPDLESFLINDITATFPTWTQDQIDAEVLARMGVDPVFIDGHRNKTHGDNSDAYSRGKEVEITYNPSRHWTVRTTIAQSRPLNGTMSPALQEYINNRLQVWQTVKGPSGAQYWTTSQVGTTPQAWYTSNLLAPIKLALATQGKLRPQTREWRVNLVTNLKLAGLSDNRWIKNADIGGGLRWEDKANIGYLGAAPDPDGIVRSLDPEKPVYDKAHTYVDFMAGYNLKLTKTKVRLQVNVNNVFESGRLQPVAVNPDGRAWAYRIIDPRTISLSATVDL